MNNQDIENEVAEKGLNIAPRCTLDSINELCGEYTRAQYHVFNGVLTVCCITLPNGFTVTGESACVSSANFNKDLGEKASFERAKTKVWQLEGYLLREQLSKEFK